MGETLENNGLSVDHINVEEAKKSNNGVKSHKCNKCEFACFWASDLKRHSKIHSEEKSNKCNLRDSASSQAANLRTHLKIHSEEKSNKCN